MATSSDVSSPAPEMSPFIDTTDPGVRSVIDRYVDLMARMLTRTGFDPSIKEVHLPMPNRQHLLLANQNARLNRFCWLVAERTTVDPEDQRLGLIWPADAETMVGMVRLRNLIACVRTVLDERIPGDLLEAGVWRGGSVTMMRAVLAAYGDLARSVWVVDSFQGLPKPKARQFPADAHDSLWEFSAYLGVSREQVEQNFAKYDLLDEQVRFLEGFFEDTLPTAPIGPLVVLRLDADMYQSTIEALTHLYPKPVVGGFLIVDDYWVIEACRRAVHDYRDRHGITEPIIEIDGAGVYWRRVH